MKQISSKSIEIPAAMEDYKESHSFIGNQLNKYSISKEIISETMLVYEALFQKLLEQGFDEKTILTIKVVRTFSEVTVRIGFEGQPFSPTGGNPGTFSPEEEILKAYNDKIGYSYRSGYNSIRISVKRSYQHSMIFCGIGFVLAVLVFLPIHFFVSLKGQIVFISSFLYPLLKLFANAILMIATPVTFFSLLKNLTDTYIIAERSFVGRKLQLKTVVTSFIAVFLAIVMSLIILLLIGNLHGSLKGLADLNSLPSFSELISSLLPGSIIEPFETFMPFPVIFIALLVTFACCSVGKYFDSLKKAIDAAYTLFAKMLNILMFSLPFFFFLTVLNSLLTSGFTELLVVIELVSAVAFSLSAMAAFYMLRLRIGGVKIRPFLKKLFPLVRENYKIGSVIDAAPFNVRYCIKNYGMNRKRISDKLPFLAQINLDGNCFLIMMGAMVLIILFDADVSLYNVLVIAILVVFLSFGAPNQPGSILIGMLIITMYLRADMLTSIAIYAEVFYGPAQNIINVIGDIVTIAIEENKIQPLQES